MEVLLCCQYVKYYTPTRLRLFKICFCNCQTVHSVKPFSPFTPALRTHSKSLIC